MTEARHRIRVLLVLHELSLSGAPKLALDLFNELSADIEIRSIAVLGGPLADRCRKLGRLDILPRIPMDGPAASKLGPRLSRSITNAVRLRLAPISADLTRWNPDVIYYNSVWSSPAATVLKMPNAPSLMHVHELEIGIAMAVRKYRNEILNAPNHYIAVSDAVRRALEIDHKIQSNQISVIHGAIPDGDLVVRQDDNRFAAEQKRPFIVGGCGSPYWRKGVFLWLQVASDVVRQMGSTRVKFQWVGVSSDDEMIMCIESARKMAVLNCVEFIAKTPDPSVYFKNFDIFAMTSIEDPCPIVVLENMNFGTPVVCFSDGGGTVEEIGESGISIDGFSVTAMSNAIVALLEDPARRQELGNRTGLRLRENFVTSVQAPKILEVMKQTASNPM